MNSTSRSASTNSMAHVVSLVVRWPLGNQTLLDRVVAVACLSVVGSLVFNFWKSEVSQPPTSEAEVNPSEKAQAIYGQTQSIPVIDSAMNGLIRGSVARANRRADDNCAQVVGACQMAGLKDLADVKYLTESVQVNPDDVIGTLIVSVDGKEHRVDLTKDEASALLSAMYAASALALDDVARTEAIVSIGDTNEGITQFYQMVQPLAEQRVTENLNRALEAESSPASITQNLTKSGVTQDNAKAVAARYVESSMTRGQTDPAANPQAGK